MTKTSHHFDVAILGGGTAGCVLAARLSEDRRRSVALIEAGHDYGAHSVGNWPTDLLDARAIPESHAWDYPSEYTPLAAKVIGGSSTHNGCLIAHATPADHEEWSDAGGNDWSLARFRGFVDRAERQLLTRDVEAAEVSPWAATALAAGAELGLPTDVAFNDESSTEGGGLPPINAVGTVRWNAAFAYLDGARERSNLHVVPDSLVNRLVFEDRRAVQAVIRSPGGEEQITAGTFIVAGGAYGSPAILLRSGVGPPEELHPLAIEPTLEREGVGRNLCDHPSTRMLFEPTPELRARTRSQEESGRLFAFQSQLKARSSKCPAGTFDLHLLSATRRVTDESDMPTGDFLVHVTAVVLKPQSRGAVRLRSADPLDKLVIEPRFLSDEAGADLTALVDGMVIARSLAATPAMSSAVQSELKPGPGVETRDELRAYAGERHQGLYHPVGTCRMGRSSDPKAVVDGSGRVHGLENVLVADASILPTPPRANTNLSVVAAAELIAERFRESSSPTA